MMKQSEINDFRRKYFNLSIARQEGHICHDPGTTWQHRKLVNEVCEWASANKLTYFTRVHLSTGKIVDIVIPELSNPFVEVRSSEEKKDKEYLSEYNGMITFVDVSDPFKLM